MSVCCFLAYLCGRGFEIQIFEKLHVTCENNNMAVRNFKRCNIYFNDFVLKIKRKDNDVRSCV